MTKKLHQISNISCYLICLFWGEWLIIQLFEHRYLTIFLISFIYSFLLSGYYKIVKKAYS